ncbi:MAG: AAA family ATPase, partial [Clostridia bacterium]|nr:AAA family ATPase [Clostridia bacterium]
LLDRVKTGNKEFTVYEEEDSFHRTLRWDDYSKFKDVTHPSMKDHYADYEHTKGIYSGAFRRPSNGNTQEFINSAGILGELLRNYDLGKKCVFIIDEINRGNISKIFGELITLIEDDKRERDSVVLPYTKEPFTVPRNVYILGTMNTADRSIALMDTALRRRFNFVEMMPEAETLKNATVGSISVGALLKAINDRIEYLYDREHTIGHAYFKEFIKGEGDLNTLRSIFKNRIIPLLQEYFYDDYEKISLVLGDQAVASDAERFVIKVRVPAEFANTLYDEGEKFRINKDIFDPTKCSDAAFEKRLTAICGKAQPRQDDATDA